MNPTNEHREQAREIIGNVNNYAEESTGELSISAFGPLATRIAEALSSRDREVREVLEGLAIQVPDGLCWCAVASDPHEPECFAASALYAKLQPKQ